MRLFFVILMIFICISSGFSQTFAAAPVNDTEKSVVETPEGSSPLITEKAKPDTSNTKATESVAPQNDKGEEEIEGETVKIADPLRPWNNAMYHFNDKLYFWVLKPVSQGYSKAVPEDIRLAVSNFFSNLAMPIRFVSNLLQLKIKNAGNELLRFVYNTTAGVGGLADAAKLDFGIKQHDEDLGQTLGSYGIGHGFYLVWPFLGPSSLRDTLGRVGDTFLDPVSYVTPWEAAAGIKAYDKVNETTFHIGDYEDLKKSAIDPYVSLRDAYVQYRKKKVEETDAPSEENSRSSSQPKAQTEIAQKSISDPEPDQPTVKNSEPEKQAVPVPEPVPQPVKQTEPVKEPAAFFGHAETFVKLPELNQKQDVQKPVEKIEPVEKKKPAEKKEPIKTSVADKQTVSNSVHVQIGAFKNKSNAEDIRENYKKKGYDAFISESPAKKSGAFYRVLIGNFSNRKEADRMAYEIRRKEKIDTIICHK